MPLYDYLLAAARDEPERPALELFGRTITVAQLAAEARRVAAGLTRLDVRPGEAVGVVLPNLPQFVSTHFGVLMAGGIFVPLNVLLTGPEIAYQVADSRVRVLVVHEWFLENVAAGVEQLDDPPRVFVVGENSGPFEPFAALLAEADDDFTPVEVGPESTVQTIYTSGTTGKPKGAQITAANVEHMIDMFDGALPFEPGDRFLCVLPLFHVFGLNGCLLPMLKQGNVIVLHLRFEPEACAKALAEDGITVFAGVPTMYFHLLKHPQVNELRFPALRFCITGGAAMPLEVMNEFERRFAAPIFEGYGLTETTVCVCLNQPDRRKPGSIGLPLEGVEVRVVDDAGQALPRGEIGELVFRGPNVMCGYLHHPEETAEVLRDGWFHTGDVGYQDDDGFVFIVDRKKDMILKGGFNIYPREIEEVLYALPQIAEAAVVGIADEAKGETVRAFVALKPEQELDEDAIREWLESRLARYKLPQDYVFLEELPKGPTGKILKRQLRELG